jgi:GTP-binding protein HflX
VSFQDRKHSVESEAAILVGVLLPDHPALAHDGDPLDELSGLAETAGATVVGRMLQRRQSPNAATYVGHGKVE